LLPGVDPLVIKSGSTAGLSVPMLSWEDGPCTRGEARRWQHISARADGLVAEAKLRLWLDAWPSCGFRLLTPCRPLYTVRALRGVAEARESWRSSAGIKDCEGQGSVGVRHRRPAAYAGVH
jgi:hypothetical protein